MKKISDSVLEQYSKSTENCLRGILLKGLESSCVVRQNTACCSVCCGGKVPYPKLDLLTPGPRQYRKSSPAVREISVDLKKKLELELKEERNSVMAERPHMRLLGPQYMCCDAVIRDICSRASSITCVDDLNSITLLRTELRPRFYDVVCRTVGSAPPAKKRRKK